jgi:hypothetical protein
METLQILYTSLYEHGAGPRFVFGAAAILLGEHLQAVLEMLEAGICASL